MTFFATVPYRLHLQKKNQNMEHEPRFKSRKDWSDMRVSKPAQRIEGRIEGRELEIKLSLARRRA